MTNEMAMCPKAATAWFGLGSDGMFAMKTVWAWVPVRSEEGGLLWMEWVLRREEFVFDKHADAGNGRMVVKHWPTRWSKRDSSQLKMGMRA